MLEVVKNEALWFPSALVSAAIVVAIVIVRYRRAGMAGRATISRALNVYFGCMIAIMGSGHLLVVTIKALEGTLEQGVRWFLYPLGLAIAIPGWLLVASTTTRRMTIFNALLVVVLVALGPAGVLAIPAVLNLIYLHVPRRSVAIAIPVLSATLYAVLFAFTLIRGGGEF